MKTLKYLLVPALTGILFAACNTEPKGPTQAELDMQVDAKVQTATDQLKADCDMRIMQAAQLQADSILAKSTTTAGKPTAPKTRTTTTTTTTKTTVPPPTIGNGKPKMGGSKSNEVGNGKPKLGDKDEKGKVDDTKIGNGKPKMGGNK